MRRSNADVLGLITSFDDLLALVAAIAWVLMAVYTIFVFVSAIRHRGLRFALIRLFSYRVLLPLLLVIGIQLLSAALVFIQPQEVGVVVSIVSPRGIRPEPLRGGLHWIMPFFERAVTYPIYWQTYTMAGRPYEGSNMGDDSIRARTSDGQEVRLDTSVIFRIDSDRAVSIHIEWQDRYVSDLVRPLVRGLVRTQVSQFTVREVNSSVREELRATLDRLFREAFAERGLILDQFLLRDVTFTPEYAMAVEQKQVAFEVEEQKRHEAQQIRNLAQGRADAIQIEAQAQANALKLIADALKENKDLVTYHYIEKLAPNIRAMLVPSQTPLILPMPRLDDMIPAEQPASMPTSTPSPPAAAPEN